MPPTPADWLRLLALSVIWGSSFMAVTIAVQGLAPLTVAAARIVIGAGALLLVLRLLDIPLPPRRGARGRRLWGAALAFGFFSMALPFFLLSWGQQHVASGFAGVSMAAVPLLVLPLAHFLVPGERMSAPRVAGFLTGFLGVVLLIGPDAFASLGTAREPLARLACLGAAASYALGAIVTRRAPEADPVAFATAATLLAAGLIAPVALLAGGIPPAPAPTALLAVLYLGLVPTALANLLLVALIRSAGAGFMSLVNYLVPLWAVVFGTLFLHEALPGRLFLAMGLILGGLALSRRGGGRAPPDRGARQ